MKAIFTKLLTLLIRSLWSITKLLSIIYIINNLTLRLQLISQEIFTQNFVIDQQKDKQVISFHGLLLIEKVVVFFMAYVLVVLLKLIGGSMKGKDVGETVEHFHQHNVNSSQQMDMEINTMSNNKNTNLNTCFTNPIPTKHQLLIGLCSTISVLLFVESQYTLFPQQMSYMKHMGLFVIFVIINYWFIDYFEVMKIPFISQNSSKKWSIAITIMKYLYLLFKCIQFYGLSKWSQVIVRNNIPYDHYYGMWFEQFSTVKFDDYSFSTKWDLWLAIGLEGLGYAVIFWVKANYINMDTQESCIESLSSACDFNIKNSAHKSNINHTINTQSSSQFINTNSIISTFISTLQMSLAFVKYSIIVLIIYSIFIAGDFHQTLSYLKNYPQSYYTLIKYGLMNFIICLSYAYCVVCYSPSVFLTVFATRRVFQKFQKRYQDGGFRQSLQGVILVMGLVCLQLIVYEWFASRQQQSNSYDKVNEKVTDQPSTSRYMYSDDRGEKFQMTQTINPSEIGIHDEIASNEIQKLNDQQQQ